MISSKNKTRDRLDLLLNLVIVVTTAWAVAMYFFGEPDILGSHDVQCFKYFTTDSNILAAIGSALYLCYRSKGRHIPGWLTGFKFVGTVAASITLLTVVFFLIPVSMAKAGHAINIWPFFAGNVFVLHLSTPVLSIISTLFVEREAPVSRGQALCGVLPSMIYGAVYLVMVVFLKVWVDWYGFTFGGRYQFIPVVMIVMLVFTLALSFAQRAIRNHFTKRS